MDHNIIELIGRAHLTYKRRVTRDLAPFGVNPKQIFLLRRLSTSDGIAPSEIADMFYADRPTVTSMLGTLERAGWIERVKDPRDGRRLLVTITALGREKLASVPMQLWRSGQTRFDPEACLEPEERTELARLLDKLIHGLEDEPD